jgi:glutaredoxin-like protein NrdH
VRVACGRLSRVTVTVYSTPDCVQCRLTYVALEKAGIAYTVVDLAQDAVARRYVTRDLGHTTAPVVVVDGEPVEHWSGFRRERIAALAARQTPT